MEYTGLPLSLDNINMPYSTEAEQSVLGAVLLENSCLPEVIDILKPEFFYNDRHKLIFSAMRRLFNANIPVDLVTVSQ